MKHLTLITGGARSGKSALAEHLASSAQLPVFYLATMIPIVGDSEQAERIERHQKRRPVNWQTIEAPRDLCAQLRKLPSGPKLVIIDCLSVFVANLLLGEVVDKDLFDKTGPYAREEEIIAEVDELLSTLSYLTNIRVITVTNEVGSAVVPHTDLGRAYRDFLGIANQKFAAAADEVWLTVCGLPVAIKPSSSTLMPVL